MEDTVHAVTASAGFGISAAAAVYQISLFE
jgi:hypothetical protein